MRVVVVSPKFCAPDVVSLTVRRKVMSITGGELTVTDAYGAVVLQVKRSVLSVRSNRRILIGAARQPILSIHEKVLSMHPTWEVFRGDSSSSSDLLFTAKRCTFLKLRTEMNIFLAGNTAQQVCDFKMKGSYFDRNCAIYLGNSNTMIAQITRKYTVSDVLVGKDTFNITVFPDVDHVFVAALVVVLDQVHNSDRS
ncbi:hypothetical protein HU200_015768 [Digitaria exilis]|uniref:Uncharacterized protein n=1 Tax=Digitaria exilis TaxID=1010633 RepID=A0A835F8B3_9POAL|nr:hypothetical protein HU200_015768 [Digitaria exilis]